MAGGINERQATTAASVQRPATALAASVMDLHVRMALQEVDREKRRLISGGLFLATGGVAMLIAMVAGEVALVLGFSRPGGFR